MVTCLWTPGNGREILVVSAYFDIVNKAGPVVNASPISTVDSFEEDTDVY